MTIEHQNLVGKYKVVWNSAPVGGKSAIHIVHCAKYNWIEPGLLLTAVLTQGENFNACFGRPVGLAQLDQIAIDKFRNWNYILYIILFATIPLLFSPLLFENNFALKAGIWGIIYWVGSILLTRKIRKPKCCWVNY